MGFSSEKYEVVYAEEDFMKEEPMCKRITAYKFFKIGDGEVNENTPYETEVTHEDFLPLSTCCTWGLKPYEEGSGIAETADTIKLRDEACPAEMTQMKTIWEEAGKQCLTVTTVEQYGLFVSHTAEVRDPSVCCDLG